MAKAKEAGVAKSAALEEIENAAAHFAGAHDALRTYVDRVAEEVRAVHARHAATVRELAAKEAGAKQAVVDAVDRNRSLFKSPKSRSLYGVKVGVRKGQDTLELGDEDRLIDRIRNLLPEQKDQLVKTNASVIRSALKKLSGDALQRLGVHYRAGADEAFATVEKSDAEKMAQAILDSAAGGER
ncbi:MAG: host-nuclease inhibitor Gam family protein [Marivibrio sp.]|uniref:host-nuclease inhibitor Gam family protein n=1 Tax=Marivibrio sp. TaxID=2039719 RepID=UPI0032EED6B5